MAIALYPGTFDPVTLGHLDVLSRASRLFEQVIVAVASGNSAKSTMFSPAERVKMVEENLAEFSNVTVELFDGLLVEHARDRGATVLVRGLRVISDFEYEFQLANMNRALNKDIETAFLTPSEHLSFISSSLVREISSLGGDVSPFVPAQVLTALQAKHRR